jgi:chromate transporter
VAELFLGFVSVGIMGFGGVLATARHMMVEERKWLTAAEFAEVYGLCQFLPGGNIMNVSVAVGWRFRGLVGSLACLLGLLIGPVAIIIILGVVYDQYKDLPRVKGALLFLSAAATAFMLATALKVVEPLRSRPLGIIVAITTFALIALLNLPLLIVLPVVAAVSIALIWRTTP